MTAQQNPVSAMTREALPTYRAKYVEKSKQAKIPFENVQSSCSDSHGSGRNRSILLRAVVMKPPSLRATCGESGCTPCAIPSMEDDGAMRAGKRMEVAKETMAWSSIARDPALVASA